MGFFASIVDIELALHERLEVSVSASVASMITKVVN